VRFPIHPLASVTQTPSLAAVRFVAVLLLVTLAAIVPAAAPVAAGDVATVGETVGTSDMTGTADATGRVPMADTVDNGTAAATGPRIVELYPNPTTDENRGEYLVVRLPEEGNWSLSDGYHEVDVPLNATGTVALSMAPETTAALLGPGSTHAARSNHTGHAARADREPVELRALDGYFPLSASGDRIELRRDGATVDVVEYDRVREGYRWRVGWGEWRPRGYVPRSPKRTANATVTPFVLPDAPGASVDSLRGADERLLLAGYTLESTRVANLLVDAADRGVTVRVLVEGSPVGGFSVRSAQLLDRLVAHGVEVRVLDDDPERFRFHHAKYAVADDRAVVLTENWKASGTGGRTNRGWGVVTEPAPPADPSTAVNASTTADDLAGLFHNDATGADARSWESFRADTEFHDSGTANGTYPIRFAPPSDPMDADVELLTAPGNAADRMVARIDAADNRVLAVVPRTGGPDDRIVRALRRAADRGVDTHLLLSNAWYDREENRALANELAAEPIEVAVAEPRGRYGKIHAKGLVVDDTAIVGSLNWNEGAATENREVLLAVEDESVADFYARAYAADWRGGGVHLPVGLLGGLSVALAGAGVIARREVALS
jgi:phosphatidylserine/phosphatidylglycerophosphate/cardiolipin synthase-like enzyme